MSSVAIKLGGILAGCGGLAALEVVLTRRYSHTVGLLQPTTMSLAVPRLYGSVLLNAVGSAFVMLALSLKVGTSRKSFIEKAKKDGDENAEERFGYPKVYAEGFGKLAKEFNCIQRGHQHAMETYPQMLVCSLVGGLKHPILTSMAQLAWMIARFKFAGGYASGDPQKRMSSKWAGHIWTSLFLVQTLAASTGVQVLFGL
mmetsp:Transcript_15364/g.29730  ORF Transcript_15364/g.29730 Transcript_15364/m.29730 type:complete len:200 (-) Transcript_15364:73-672(-)